MIRHTAILNSIIDYVEVFIMFELVVGLVDGNGNLLTSQPYDEYQYGKRSIEIVIQNRGRRLIEILQDDLGYISYRDNIPKLQYILQLNSNISTMTLLGRIAEAVLVRRCREDSTVNKKLFELARKKNAWQTTADRFMALGTGHLFTKKEYPARYNPSDPQRDIVWIDKEGNLALIVNSSGQAGIEAGLQVKASLDGINYILQDITNCRYEVPIVYFPIKNDYDLLISRLYKRSIQTGDNRFLSPEDFVVDICAYDYIAYEEVMDYYPIVKQLIDGELELYELVKRAYGDSTLQNIVIDTALQTSNAGVVIEL